MPRQRWWQPRPMGDHPARLSPRGLLESSRWPARSCRWAPSRRQPRSLGRPLIFLSCDLLSSSLTVVRTLSAELGQRAFDSDTLPSRAARRPKANSSTGSGRPSSASPAGGKFLLRWRFCCLREAEPASESCTAEDRARLTGSASPPEAGCAPMTRRPPRRGRWCGASPSGWARTSMSPSSCARARRASAPRQSTAARRG